MAKPTPDKVEEISVSSLVRVIAHIHLVLIALEKLFDRIGTQRAPTEVIVQILDLAG
jgi:hypothetical protein